MKVLKIAAFVLLAAAVASCCSCRSKSRGGLSLIGNSWQVIQMDGMAFTAGADNFTIDFGADGRISGIGDCNRLMGGYTTDASGRLSFDGAASTRMFCVNQQDEDRFMQGISRVDGYSIDGDNLILTENGNVVMILKKK